MEAFYLCLNIAKQQVVPKAIAHRIQQINTEQKFKLAQIVFCLIAIVSAVSQPHLTIGYFDVASDRFTVG